MDKSILDCNLKLGLLKLQDETAGTSHRDIDQDDVSLAGMLQGAWCSWSCSLLLFHPSVRASLLNDNTGTRRRFSNTSASRGQVDAVFAPVQIGFYAQSWSYFSGVDFGRSEHVLFIFNWQNELMRSSTNVASHLLSLNYKLQTLSSPCATRWFGSQCLQSGT